MTPYDTALFQGGRLWTINMMDVVYRAGFLLSMISIAKGLLRISTNSPTRTGILGSFLYLSLKAHVLLGFHQCVTQNIQTLEKKLTTRSEREMRGTRL